MTAVRPLKTDPHTESKNTMTKDKLIETLAATKNPYFREKFKDVDWAAVHALRVRAPRYVTFSAEVNTRWTDGEWVYVGQDGTLSFNEVHIAGIGFADATTAAVYRRTETDESEMHWDRRMHYTTGLTPDEIGRVMAAKKIPGHAVV